MPNWCTTQYCFYGDIDSVNDFTKKVEEYTSKNFMENGFGTSWLGNIVLGFGFPYEDNSFNFRGWITDIEKQDDCLYMYTETAWGPMPEMWDAIIEKYYTDDLDNHLIGYELRAEEPGMGIYINTDVDGRYLPERYYLELYGIPERMDYDDFYFETEEEVVDMFNLIFRKDFMLIEEVEMFIESYTEELRKNKSDGYIVLHQYEYEY